MFFEGRQMEDLGQKSALCRMVMIGLVCLDHAPSLVSVAKHLKKGVNTG